MKILGVIPARYASTRFPGKPLVVIQGKTMIRRVYEQALQCDNLARVIVATDNEAIVNHVRLFNGHAVMTGQHHATGTERCAEVVEKLEADGESYDAVINIQGDEPFIQPVQISLVASLLEDDHATIATLIKEITTPGELQNENVVKVVVDQSRHALLFSRAPIPFMRGTDPALWLTKTKYFKHIGIYGYQTGILKELVALPVSGLEKAESLEQLRWLDHGHRIMTKLTDIENVAIDTPSDLLKLPT